MFKFFLVLLFSVSLSFSFGATVLVTNTNDSGAGSLRTVVANINNGDVIRFSPSLIAGGSATISLSSKIVSLYKEFTIIGLYNSTDSLFISGNNNRQIFLFDATGTTNKKITMDSVLLINSRTTDDGGAILFRGQELILKNSIIRNCESTKKGGAIYVESFSYTYSLPITLKIYNSKLIGNKSNRTGGAVYFKSNKQVRVEVYDSEISNNISSWSDAAAIYSYSQNSSSTVILENSIFLNNIGFACTSINGFSLDSSYLIINNCLFDSNSSGVGSENIIIKNSVISNSLSQGIGGHSLIIDSCQIFNNNNGIGVGENGNLTLLKSNVYGNTGRGSSLGGGGIESYGSVKMKIDNSKIFNNSTGSNGDDGGGIYIKFSNSTPNYVELEINESEIYNNQANDLGGGIYLYSTTAIININNTLIYGNSAGNSGAGMYLASTEKDLIINGCSINNNLCATGNGGGIYSYISYDLISSYSKIKLKNSSIYKNQSLNGAGIFVDNTGASLPNINSEINIEDSNLDSNIAVNDGGAIYSEGKNSSKIECNRSSFFKNSGRDGGAIYSTSQDSASTILILNSAFDSNSSTRLGGALFSHGENISAIICHKSSFTNNKTSGTYGGGIYSDGDTLSLVDISSSTFYKNEAFWKGGAVYSDSKDSSLVSVKNSTLYKNKSLIEGAAILSDGGTIISGRLNITSSLMFNNSTINNFKCGSIVSDGYNFFSDSSIAGWLLTVNHMTDSFNIDSSKLLLGSLQNNGGITLSMMPDSGSILINSGNPLDFSNAQNWAITDSRRDAGAAEKTCFSTIYDTVIRCNSFTSPSGRHVWHTSGIYYDSIFSTTGCDSLIYIDLTINATRSRTFPTDCNSYISQTGNQYFVSGLYYDTLINSVGCDSIIEINLIINQLDTSVTLINPNSLSSNDSLATYQWLDCNNGGSIIVNDTNRVLNPYLSGAYSVELTVNGCKDTSSCYSIIGYGLGLNEDYLLNQVLIYPNPNSGIFTLQLNKGLNVDRLFITDINGRLIKEITPRNTLNYEINFEGAAGIYFLNVVSENERRTMKLVKE